MTDESVKMKNIEDEEWKPVREGVFRKAFSGEGGTVAVNRLMPGHAPNPHSHPHEQITYILSGKVNFHLGDKVYLLTKGGFLHVPPNVSHYAEVIGEEEVINIDFFVPKREEYST